MMGYVADADYPTVCAACGIAVLLTVNTAKGVMSPESEYHHEKTEYRNLN